MRLGLPSEDVGKHPMLPVVDGLTEYVAASIHGKLPPIADEGRHMLEDFSRRQVSFHCITGINELRRRIVKYMLSISYRS